MDGDGLRHGRMFSSSTWRRPWKNPELFQTVAHHLVPTPPTIKSLLLGFYCSSLHPSLTPPAPPRLGLFHVPCLRKWCYKITAFFLFLFCSSWLSLIRGPYLGRLFPPAPRLVPPPPGELPPSLQWNVSCRKIKCRLRAEESEPGEVGRSPGRTTEGSSQYDRAWVSDRCSFTLMTTRFYTFFFLAFVLC